MLSEAERKILKQVERQNITTFEEITVKPLAHFSTTIEARKHYLQCSRVENY